MAIPAIKHTTPEEYLALERAAKEKHEYFEGRVFAMAGASLAHNDIVANLIMEVGNLLKGKPCRILPSDIRIAVPSGESYMYPDATIICGEPELTDNRFDTLKNPMVIFEILSPSTEGHDRGRKFFFYRQIPSFQEYILIDSTEPWVEMSYRQPDGSWRHDATSNPEGHVFIESIKAGISMEDIYRNVTFKPVQ